MIFPKYKIYGILIQAFQCREFGFGYPFKVPYLQTINGYHALQPKYIDTDSETTMMGHTHK